MARHSAGGGKARLKARACASSFAQMTVAAAAFPVETEVVIFPERLPDQKRRDKRTDDFRDPRYYIRVYTLYYICSILYVNLFYSSRPVRMYNVW